MFERISAAVAAATGQPSSFMLASGIIALWGISGLLFGWSDTWQLVINTGTTIITFLMVFLIQNAQNRDASAIQAKLDVLIRAGAAHGMSFIGIEHMSETELVGLRRVLEEVAGNEIAHHRAIERLVARR